jgi:hypothetical protein
MRKEQVVRRRVLRIRKWLVLAVALLALATATSAQAQLYGGDGQGRASGGTSDFVRMKSAPVARTAAAFDWGYVMAGAGAVGLVVAISGVALLQVGRNRRRLATLL